MTLHPQAVYTVPEDTVRVARAAFPNGKIDLRMHDELGRLYADQDFAPLFPRRGQPALAPAQLALVTLMQFAEGLTDRQAADAVRSRIEWKYALCLELTDPGFHYSVLSAFRTRLVAGEAEALLFEQLLGRCREAGLLRARGRQRTDSTRVLAAIRTLNRLELVGETLRQALAVLVTVAPDWLRQHLAAEWVDRYGPRLEEYRLPAEPAARQEVAMVIGTDGLALLHAVAAPQAPPWLREVPAVETLRQVWVQHYYAPDEAGVVRWRAEADLPPPALRLSSPDDPEARVGSKRETTWLGYLIHLTETCAPDAPLLISDVQTTLATTADDRMTDAIHSTLAQRDLLPQTHLVDPGYISADQLVASQTEHAVDLLGPTLGDNPWQARTPGACAIDDFSIDWEARQVHCPQGQPSVAWSETHDPDDRAVSTVRFATATCRACPCRAQCTRAVQGPRRLTLRPQAQHLALRAARAREPTPECQAQDAQRAGVEGLLSQGVRAFGLRQARYIGVVKTRLQHLLTAAAMNLVRLNAWWTEQPRAATRPNKLAVLLSQPLATAPLT